MGESVKDILEHLCRLCARTDSYCLNVFSSDGEKNFIQKKIRLCLPVIVEEQDDMPRQICLSCLSKLDSTYEFYTACISAQSTIQRLLKAESQEDNDNVIKHDNETKEQNPTSFSLDQYLKRKIDPVDTGKPSKVPKTDDVRNNNVCAERPGSEASRAEPQKPKLRVKTTSELRMPVEGCGSALTSLQASSTQSVSITTTKQSTGVSTAQSPSVVCSQPVVLQSVYSAASVQRHVESSSASKGGASLSPAARNVKIASSVHQFGRSSSSVTQGIASSPSVVQFGTSSSSALQTVTNTLSVPRNATALLPVLKNTSVQLPTPQNVSLPVSNSSTASVRVPMNTTTLLNGAKSSTVSLAVPQNVNNSSPVQHYTLSLPNSLSSGCTILPNVSQYIIVPDTFASSPTFTAAGPSTVAVLAPAVASSVSLVGDGSVPLGQATAVVTPQSARPGSVRPPTVSTTSVPLASSSLPLVQTVPLQLAHQLPTPVTTSPTSISCQSSAAAGVTYTVLDSNSRALVTSSDPRVAVTTSAENVLSKAHSQLPVPSQNLKVISSSSVNFASSVPVRTVSKVGKTIRLQRDSVVQGSGNTISTVLLKHKSGAQLRTTVVTVSSAVSNAVIQCKPTTTVATSAKNITSNFSSLPLAQLNCLVANIKKGSAVQPEKNSGTGRTQSTKTILEILNQNSNSQQSVTNEVFQKAIASAASNRSTTKVIGSPRDTTTGGSSVQSASSGSPGPTQQVKQGLRSIVPKTTNGTSSVKSSIRSINIVSAANTQSPVGGAASNVKTDSQLSENRSQQKASPLRSRPSGGLPPPPPAVRLNTLGTSESGRSVPKTDSAELQKGESATVSTQANKTGLASKPRSAVVTATVSPFTATRRPASGPKRQPPESRSPEAQAEVDPVESSSLSPPAAGPGSPSPSQSPSPPAVAKEECPHCHVVFPTNILIHHKALHYREKFYTCIDCDKNFVTEKGLETHRCQKESKG